MFSFPDLRGKTLLITGVTRGIGRALLPYFLEQGMQIIAVSKGEEELAATRRSLRVSDAQFRTLECDLADAGGVRETAGKILASGVAIDAVLHNAAIDPRHAFERECEAFWQEVFQINLFSAVALTQRILPALRGGKQGRIVFVGSVMSELGGANLSAYSASKGAIVSLTRSLAHELKSSDITVNCLLPGAICVEKEPVGADEILISWQSVPRRLTPADLAAPICLLLSRWGSAIDGQVITVDGGILHPLASPEVQGRVCSSVSEVAKEETQ